MQPTHRASTYGSTSALSALTPVLRCCTCCLAPLLQVGKDEEARAFLRRLNDDRNPGLADRIDALHGAGKRVFAAVGALHMTGAKGLPGLMAQRGYIVERLPYPR